MTTSSQREVLTIADMLGLPAFDRSSVPPDLAWSIERMIEPQHQRLSEEHRDRLMAVFNFFSAVRGAVEAKNKIRSFFGFGPKPSAFSVNALELAALISPHIYDAPEDESVLTPEILETEGVSRVLGELKRLFSDECSVRYREDKLEALIDTMNGLVNRGHLEKSADEFTSVTQRPVVRGSISVVRATDDRGTGRVTKQITHTPRKFHIIPRCNVAPHVR